MTICFWFQFSKDIMFSTSMFINFFPHHPLVEMEGNNIEDVSSFFLFEATGDSEGDSTSLSTDTARCTVSNSMVINDAESCSDGAADDPPSVYEINGDDLFYEDEDEDGDGDGDEQSYGYGCEAWSKPSGSLIETSMEFRKSNDSIDSTKDFEMMNEMEKNRLFWETCLAS